MYLAAEDSEGETGADNAQLKPTQNPAAEETDMTLDELEQLLKEAQRDDDRLEDDNEENTNYSNMTVFEKVSHLSSYRESIGPLTVRRLCRFAYRA
jgi:hypothetical protein